MDIYGSSPQACTTHEHLQEITLKKKKKLSVMEMPRHRDDRLPCLRLDRKSVTGALCLVTPNPFTHCHPVSLTTMVCVLSPNTLTTHILLSQSHKYPGRGSSRPSHFKEEETEGQREQVNVPSPQCKRGVKLGCELCLCSLTLFFKVSGAPCLLYPLSFYCVKSQTYTK